MAENLLRWMPKLTEEDRKEIADAVRNHGPSRHQLNYNDIALGLLNREVVIAALHEVYRIFGTAAALATARKLSAPPDTGGY
jgi:hypothetical protein